MKKKRNSNKTKSIKIGLVILVIIIVLVMVIVRKKAITQVEKSVETVSTSSNEKKNVITVELNRTENESKLAEWNLILVNKENKIPEDYQFQLQEIEPDHKVDSRIIEPLTQMLSDARKQRLKPFICSSYRTTTTQTTLFNQKLREYKNLGYGTQEAEEKASYWVTFPGTSEHEIGLAVDIVSTNYQILDQNQENTSLQKWLMEHCVEYGFILRYPTYKKEITKINYEPWHYRYVGVENAKFMKEKDF